MEGVLVFNFDSYDTCSKLDLYELTLAFMFQCHKYMRIKYFKISSSFIY
jgi:hypothetical protein